MREIQVIYYDQSDYDQDGLGWNVIDTGSIASRYETVDDAVATCQVAYVLMSDGVTPDESVVAIQSIKVGP